MLQPQEQGAVIARGEKSLVNGGGLSPITIHLSPITDTLPEARASGYCAADRADAIPPQGTD